MIARLAAALSPRGRLTRTRYWIAAALQSVIVMGLVAANLLVFGEDGPASGGLPIKVGLGLATAIVAISGVALTVRRLRDAGRSGWWSLLAAIPLVGGLLLLVQASRRDVR